MSVIFSSALKNLFKKNKENESTSETSDKEKDNRDTNGTSRPSRIFPEVTESGKRSEEK